MDEPTTQTWWKLHERLVRDEPLSTEEQALYDEGLTLLHDTEALSPEIQTMRNLRRTISGLELEGSQLRARKRQLDLRIAEIEQALDEKTQRLMGVES